MSSNTALLHATKMVETIKEERNREKILKQ